MKHDFSNSLTCTVIASDMDDPRAICSSYIEISPESLIVEDLLCIDIDTSEISRSNKFGGVLHKIIKHT